VHKTRGDAAWLIRAGRRAASDTSPAAKPRQSIVTFGTDRAAAWQ